MRIGSAEWVATVIQGAARMGHTLTTDHVQKMALHARLLVEWNRRINLTAITDPLQIAVKHCLDAIAPLHLLPNEGALLDIGTGGGFPGIPLKIMRPDLFMTLIDSIRKKISFVKHVIRQLDLQQIEALHARAQSLAGQEGCKGRYQVVVCRALSGLNAIVQMALPLLAPQGRIIVYQGPNDCSGKALAMGELSRLSLSVETISYQLPFLGDQRKVAVLRLS
jgi:16S rRNA (guanine527-N7)-methyltransferase